jgi:phytanoyl-CoA hydroxylase
MDHNKNKEEYRQQAQQVLQLLNGEAAATVAPSWVGGRSRNSNTSTKEHELVNEPGLPPPAPTPENSVGCLDQQEEEQQGNFFHHAGFLHVPNFCSMEECERMKTEMAELVRNRWQVVPGRPVEESFGTDDAQNIRRGDYFLESADQVYFFAEPTALHDNGTLRDEYFDDDDNNNNKKMEALNKVGHALHLLDEPSSFRSYCFSQKVRRLVTSVLGWRKPVVPQSMYIFKNRYAGGTVTSHQDSTFLYTVPHQTCLGLWLALDAATLDNGCLWIRPKSHREPVRRHFRRNVDYFGAESLANRSNECRGDSTALPKLVMVPLEEEGEGEEPMPVPWEGSVPDDLLTAGFIPIECQKGDLLAFCGTTDHLSLANRSESSRHTFQLHLVDDTDDSNWSPYNWLQYPDGTSFAAL